MIGAIAVAGILLSRAGDPATPQPGAAGVPVGAIVAFGGPAGSVPETSGWLLCDGRELSAATYPALAEALGAAWGGTANGATFRLPDLRGRFLRGVNGGAAGPWRDPEASLRMAVAPGGNTGDAVGTVQTESIGAHTHGLAGVADAAGPGGGAEWIRFYATKVPGPDAPVVVNTFAVQSDTGLETRPTNLGVNWIIRAR